MLPDFDVFCKELDFYPKKTAYKFETRRHMQEQDELIKHATLPESIKLFTICPLLVSVKALPPKPSISPSGWAVTVR